MAKVQIVPHGSPAYLEAVELRRRELRLPLGLDFTLKDLAAESVETHFVAIEDGRVIGCLVMVPQNCSVVKMRQVAVEPTLRSQGMGTELVQASEAWARASKYSQIELNARDLAVAFYLGLGYRSIGQAFEEVTIPHQKMVKDL